MQPASQTFKEIFLRLLLSPLQYFWATNPTLCLMCAAKTLGPPLTGQFQLAMLGALIPSKSSPIVL